METSQARGNMRAMRAKARQHAGDLTQPPVSKLACEVTPRNLSPKQRLLKRILALRNSIEAEKGILPESYPLIRQARGK
jgi:hypothetical protein